MDCPKAHIILAFVAGEREALLFLTRNVMISGLAAVVIALIPPTALVPSARAQASESSAGFSFEPPRAAGWTRERSEKSLWLGNGTVFSFENPGEVRDEFAIAQITRFYQPHEPHEFLQTVKSTIKLKYDRPPAKVVDFSVADDDSRGGPCVRWHVQAEFRRTAERTLLLEGWTCANAGGSAYIEMVAGVMSPTTNTPPTLSAAQAEFMRSLRVSAP